MQASKVALSRIVRSLYYKVQNIYCNCKVVLTLLVVQTFCMCFPAWPILVCARFTCTSCILLCKFSKVSTISKGWTWTLHAS
jgi:uncharacterized membrane protein